MNPMSLLRFNGRRALPTMLQSENAECGLACLAMIASYHGHRTDLNTLRRDFSVSRGATLRDLISCAASLNLVSRPLRLELEQLSELRCPAILHWDLNHFVVLAKAGKKSIVIHNPAVGRRRYAMKDVSRHFTGVALELTPGTEFRTVEAAPRVRIRDFWSSSTGLGSAVVQLLVLSLALQLFAITAPLYSQLVVDEVLMKQDADLLSVLAVGFMLVMLVRIGVTALRGHAALYLGTTIGFHIGSNLFRHLIRLPLAFFERRHMGDIVSRFRSVGAVRDMLTEGIISAVLDGMMSLATFAMMWVYSPTLALIVLASIAGLLMFRLLRFPYERRNTEEQIVASSNQSTAFMESARGILSVKSFARERERETLWQNLFADEVNSSTRIGRFAINVQFVTAFLSGLENIAVIYIAGKLVLDNALTLGMFFAFTAYKAHFSKSVESLIATVIDFRMLDVQLERMADIALTPREFGFEGPSTFRPQLKGLIELENIAYRYAANEPLIYQEVNLRIAPGDFLALIGPSGAGKSTLIKLMMGLFAPDEGSVRIDGEELSDFGVQNYRTQVGAVMQGDVLMSGTIAENVSFFDPTSDPRRIEECARFARMHDEIMAMPMKYETHVGDLGTKMSYGQRQRLLVARALYASPKVLFMDEATSHIDLESERQILAAVKQLGITVVVISHRPEILELATRVVTVSGSRVTEQPSHDVPNAPGLASKRLETDSRAARASAEQWTLSEVTRAPAAAPATDSCLADVDSDPMRASCVVRVTGADAADPAPRRWFDKTLGGTEEQPAVRTAATLEVSSRPATTEPPTRSEAG